MGAMCVTHVCVHACIPWGWVADIAGWLAECRLVGQVKPTQGNLVTPANLSSKPGKCLCAASASGLTALLGACDFVVRSPRLYKPRCLNPSTSSTPCCSASEHGACTTCSLAKRPAGFLTPQRFFLSFCFLFILSRTAAVPLVSSSNL